MGVIRELGIFAAQNVAIDFILGYGIIVTAILMKDYRGALPVISDCDRESNKISQILRDEPPKLGTYRHVRSEENFRADADISGDARNSPVRNATAK